MKEQAERGDSPLFQGVEGAGDPGKEVLVREPSINEMLASVANQPNAVDRVAVLERLMALKEHQEDRGARLAFESAFATMRAELPTIKKSKEVKRSGGQHMYNYAPLEEIQKTCDPILQAHGFSYSWREEAIADGKRVWFDLFGYGHTKSNCFDAPLLGAKTSREGSEITNAVQGARMTSSYAKRNSMVDGLGLVIEDEDIDGAVELDEELQKVLATMDAAKTELELLDASKKAKEKYSLKPEAITYIVGKFAECKARLRTVGGTQ
ncbi:MAG: ERF family protein [Polynucleobacter sp.]